MHMTSIVGLIGILSMIAGIIGFCTMFGWEGTTRFQHGIISLSLFLGGNISLGLSRIGIVLEAQLGIRDKIHAIKGA